MQKWTSFSTFSQRLLRRSRQERGQALIEFVVVFTFLLLPIMFGILYFGRYENYSDQQTQLAAQAARFASVNSAVGGGNLQAYILAQAPSELRTTSGNVTTPTSVYIYCTTSCVANGTNSVTACLAATVSYPGLISGTSYMLQKATQLIEISQTAASWAPSTGTAPTNC